MDNLQTLTFSYYFGYQSTGVIGNGENSYLSGLDNLQTLTFGETFDTNSLFHNEGEMYYLYDSQIMTLVLHISSKPIDLINIHYKIIYIINKFKQLEQQSNQQLEQSNQQLEQLEQLNQQLEQSNQQLEQKESNYKKIILFIISIVFILCLFLFNDRSCDTGMTQHC